MSRQGYRIFADEVARLAVDVGDERVTAVARRATAGVTVAVHGRAGVGAGSVARALATAGVDIAHAPGGVIPESLRSRPADVDVFVIAEVVKPEDRAAIAASTRPKIVVLNKADLSGFGPGGPIATARTRCGRYRELTGVATEPMVAHLAAVDLDDELLAALRTLAAEAGDLGSTDAFVTAPHRLPAEIRARLLHTLDLFGIAHAVLALRARPDADVDTMRATLRRHSGVDGVVEALRTPLAEAGYAGIDAACAALETLAIEAEPRLAARLDAFLSCDKTVIARMAAAADVVAAAGLPVDSGDDASAHLCKALRWRRYASGPVSALHRACAADITRGSMRLWQAGRT